MQALYKTPNISGSIPGSFTHCKKWYPSLFISLKMSPFFVAKHWLFNSKLPFFRYKTLDLSVQNEPLFYCKTLTFQPKWTLFFTVKHRTSKLTPFSPNTQSWVPKYPVFLEKCESALQWHNHDHFSVDTFLWQVLLFAHFIWTLTMYPGVKDIDNWPHSSAILSDCSKHLIKTM